MHYMGASPGLLRGVTGETPSGQGERSRGRCGWKQRKCCNCNRLRVAEHRGYPVALPKPTLDAGNSYGSLAGHRSGNAPAAAKSLTGVA